MDYFFPTYRKFDIRITGAKGSFIYSGKKKYLDMISGIAVLALGHNNPKIKKAIEAQLKRFTHISNLFRIDVQEKFAKEFLKTLPGKYKVFLTNSGAEATETAIKLSRLYGKKIGGRTKFLSFERSFHGRTTGALSLTWREGIRKPFEPLLGDVYFFPFGGDECFKAIKSGEYSAVFVEPIQAEAGNYPPPPGWLKEIESVCKETETLLVVDEVQSGVGRTGKFWAFEWDDIKPDVVLSAKAIGGGLPLGVCAAREDIANLMGEGLHASTFGGNPLATAAGIVVIREVSKKSFLKSVIDKGEYIKKNLRYETRGRGLLLGINLKLQGEKLENAKKYFMEKGILVLFSVEGDVRLIPPLTISKKEIDIFISAMNNKNLL